MNNPGKGGATAVSAPVVADTVRRRKEVGEVFLKESDALYRFALRSTGSPGEAEEAVARAGVRALERVDHFSGLSKLRTWLFGILVNVLREMSREGHREISLDTVALDPFPPDSMFDASGQPLAMAVPFPPNAEELLLKEERLGWVREAMQRLPYLQRSAFHLRYIEEWEPQEICTALGITDVHLRVLLHRARLGLRDALAERMRGGGA
ncbi:MAG: RNA polymerase sigma factor [Nitrospirae bacterium]|nr:RNA polymerase sigma factor [Nitrospirota bacterium]